MKMNAIDGSSTLQLEVADVIDKDEFLYSMKKRIYLQAKEGFSINLQVLISRVESDAIRNVLVNQASQSVKHKKRKIFGIIFYFGHRREQTSLVLIEKNLRNIRKVIGRAKEFESLNKVSVKMMI